LFVIPEGNLRFASDATSERSASLFVIPEGNLRFSPVRLRSSGLNQTFPRANFALLRVPFFGAEEGAEKVRFA